MKIRTSQVELLQQQEEAKKKQKAAEGFDQLLAQELGRPEAATQAKAPVSHAGANAMLNPLTQAGAVGKAGAVQKDDALYQLAGDLEGMLSQVDTYAQQIGAQPEADLKGAFATLENLSGGLAALKERNPDIAERAPELGAVMNELEVMTVTERFKMNRGDYIA